MSRQTTRDRDAAIRNMSKLGVSAYDQGRLLRLGATLQRLSEAQCNGDWPADNGERRVRPCGVIGAPQLTAVPSGDFWHWKIRTAAGVTEGKAATENSARRGWQEIGEAAGCGSYWAPSVLRSTRGYLCPDCCASEDAQTIAESYGLRAVIQGDPRGMVLGLVPKDAKAGDIDSGRVRPEYIR